VRKVTRTVSSSVLFCKFKSPQSLATMASFVTLGTAPGPTLTTTVMGGNDGGGGGPRNGPRPVSVVQVTLGGLVDVQSHPVPLAETYVRASGRVSVMVMGTVAAALPTFETVRV